MRFQRQIWILGVVLVLSCIGSSALAAPPWLSLVPFKHVEADPQKTYELEEKHGPWLVMCSSFAGETAEQQAHALVMELRTRYKLEAYTFRQSFDFTKPEIGLGYNKYGGPKRMKYRNAVKFEEIAVLAGSFQSVDHPDVAKVLEKIKHARPECLDVTKQKDTSQRFVGLRNLYRLVSTDPETKAKGPMGAAFVTKNPLLPEEYFVSKGIDPFLIRLNEDLQYNLLENPGKFTVRVASFRGIDTFKPDEFEKQFSQRSKIDEAAKNAEKLTFALREKGIEAYQFHDRTESIVTVGSFDSVGEPRPDGKTEINPAVHRIMQEYSPINEPLPGQTVAVVQPRILAGIPFDPQPLPVEVPRQSIGATYSPSNSLLR
jgi:hypothetical protein